MSIKLNLNQREFCVAYATEKYKIASLVPRRFSAQLLNIVDSTAVTRRYRQACGIGKNLNIIQFFRFKMRAKFTVADESSRKFSVIYESVVSVAIRCIFMRLSERFRRKIVYEIFVISKSQDFFYKLFRIVYRFLGFLLDFWIF